MTNYGEVFEVWFDGANGGDGYYGGAKESRTIDRKNYYNYPKIYELLNELQPQAVIFGDGGPGCRWVGNESGYASPTNWAFLRKGVVYPGYPQYRELQYGHADGDQWVPAECDVSIRPGWFYHPEEDDKVKSPEQLVDLYYRNVGHNATFLLNFPVNREGRVSQTDSINAVKFHQIIANELRTDLLKGITAKVSNTRKGQTPADLTNEDYDAFWSTEDGVTTATIEFDLGKATPVNRMMLQEYIPLGQRVKSFTVEYMEGDNWQPVFLNEETTTIGYKRLLRFPTVTTNRLRVTILEARGPIVMNRIAAFYGGEGSDAIFAVKNTNYNSSNYTLVGVDESEAKKAKDKDEATTCFVSGDQVLIDLGVAKPINSLYYLPDQSEANGGIIANYELYAGTEEHNVTTLLKKGEFSNVEHNPIRQEIHFAPFNCRYLLLKSTRTLHSEDGKIGFAELGVTEP
ncbi:MAG: alpha-L-fucosidase, partial [Bacteroidaceae bacterium]|nr:alpha-L-fucosidase [Bacteroidaceae bacterium]